jgi:hypothetical protein
MKNIAQTFVTEIGRTPVYIFVMDCLAMSICMNSLALTGSLLKKIQVLLKSYKNNGFCT